MKYAFPSLALVFALALSGCGSFFAAIGPVEEDPGKRTKGARVEDESIETKSIRRIRALGEQYADANVSVTSFNGFVLITGQVPEASMKASASDQIREIRGVRRIYNELVVSGNTSTLTRSSDTWLTTKVKSSLLAAEEIQGNRVTVVTEDGVVYLMGLVSHAEAERIVNVARSTGGVEKVVQIFEWID
ncbi:MAG: BON domain-containing protein [Halieaceae bacterium]|jgi:osmotically-inducible protein OsmY|nr:BON domain-containing protein [Halieaceae bacterium]